MEEFDGASITDNAKQMHLLHEWSTHLSVANSAGQVKIGTYAAEKGTCISPEDQFIQAKFIFGSANVVFERDILVQSQNGIAGVRHTLEIASKKISEGFLDVAGLPTPPPRE